MKSVISTISFVLILYQAAYCSELSGFLVIQSRGIQVVDLKTKNVTTLFEKGQSDLATYNQNLIFIQDGNIKKINLKTKRISQITQGFKPLYSSKFICYSSIPKVKMVYGSPQKKELKKEN